MIRIIIQASRKQKLTTKESDEEWQKYCYNPLMNNKCSRCGVCCRLFLINLNEAEYRSGKYLTEFEGSGRINNFKKAASCGANILKQRADGSCFYLCGNECSIHENRPQVCREFFCHSELKKFQGMIKQIEEKRATKYFVC